MIIFVVIIAIVCSSCVGGGVALWLNWDTLFPADASSPSSNTNQTRGPTGGPTRGPTRGPSDTKRIVKLKNKKSDTCLDLSGGNASNGAKVQGWNCSSGDQDNMNWDMIDAS